MSKQTCSSGYTSDFTDISAGYGNNTEPGHRRFDNGSPSEGKPNNKLKQQDDELDVGNVYDRIHAHDDIEDIKKDNRRPLPLPPRPQPEQPEKETFNRRPWKRFCFVFGIVFVVLVVAAVVSMKMTCFKDLLCENEKEINPSSHTPHPCDAQIQQDYSAKGSSVCTLALQSPKTFMLKSENVGTVTIPLGDSVNNVTSFTIKGMACTITRNSIETYIDIEIKQVNCSNIGTYFVTVSNGMVNETYRVNVQVNPETEQCPCARQSNIGKHTYIICKNVNKDNVTLVFRGKTSDDNGFAMNVSIDDIVANGGRLPIASDDNITLIAETVSGTTTFKLEFSLVKCSHEGTYAIAIGNKTFETVFTVKSYAKRPVIGVLHEQRGGLVEGREGGQVRCEASVGCGEKPTMWENTFDGFQLYKDNPIISTRASSSSGMTYYEAVDMNIGNEQIFNNTQFKCKFTHDGNDYESDIYTALVVPIARDPKDDASEKCSTKDWCDRNKVKQGCHWKHPFYCDRWITCVTGPIEQGCGPGTHFYFKKDHDGCQGDCGTPGEAKCTIGRN